MPFFICPCEQRKALPFCSVFYGSSYPPIAVLYQHAFLSKTNILMMSFSFMRNGRVSCTRARPFCIYPALFFLVSDLVFRACLAISPYIKNDPTWSASERGVSGTFIIVLCFASQCVLLCACMKVETIPYHRICLSISCCPVLPSFLFLIWNMSETKERGGRFPPL